MNAPKTPASELPYLLILPVWLISLAQAALHWKAVDFGPLSYSENLRQIILAVTLISAGMQTIFSSFFLSVLGLKISNRTPPSPQ